MDVKGAKALSERLAEAERIVNRKEGLLTPEQRELLKKQIDGAVRERMVRPPGQGRTAGSGGSKTAQTKKSS